MLLCAVMICSMLAGCGGKEEAAEETTEETTEGVRDLPSLEEYDVDKYVTLGEYKGITVKKSVVEVTDEELETQIAMELANNPIKLTDLTAKVEEGDTVEIDYVGTLDGVAFEGGSQEGALLTIGSGQFIDGFESGLVGAAAGQTLELNLTFPKDYHAEDLAGKDVVFTVDVNAIRRPVTELTEEWVKANSDSATIDEYRAALKEKMQEELDITAEQNLATDAWMQVVQNSTVNEYPEELLTFNQETLQIQVESYVQYTGQTVEEYLEQSGFTEESFKEEKQRYGEAVTQQMLVMQAIIDAEGYSEKDEEYQTLLEEFMTNYGLDEQGLYDTYGKNSVYQTIMMQRINEMVLAEAKIEEVK